MNETMLNIPLDAETKERLEAQAERNGRAVRREAAQIIKQAVNPPDAEAAG